MLFDVLMLQYKYLLDHEFQVLGSGFEVISVGKKKLVRSVPTELNKDHNEILELAQVTWHFLFLFSSDFFPF